MKRTEPQIIELEAETLQGIQRRTDAKQLNDSDYETIGTVFQAYVYVLDLLKVKNLSIRRMRKMVFGASTEKTEAVVGGGTDPELPQSSAEDTPTTPSRETDSKNKPMARPKGHGRNGVDAYEGAEKIEVPHELLEAGDACPECGKGTVYETSRPGVLVRITGQAPVAAKVYQLQKLRCGLCGKVFTADAPEGVGTQKYDAMAGSMIALLKYGTGMPFNRMRGLQGTMGIPLPASTQWDIVHAQARNLQPVYAELIRQAAAGDVLHNDDTTVRILELMGKRARQTALIEDSSDGESNDGESDGKPKKRQRTGMFTSGVVSLSEDRKIALFFSGRKHAGENIEGVLARRAEDLAPPIQMCDALSRNLPTELETIVANCLAHGRRQFVDVVESFPRPCAHVLETLAVVYRNDATARQRKLSSEARLKFHQAESGPTMKELHAWLAGQIEDRLVEPNSTLGGAISYMLRHWEKLTLFLRVPGAPLDNNICERALKKAILHRKNALFYKTENGAHVGDLFMSLIHTCEFCEANPFDYLTELQLHAGELAADPNRWMPWNYCSTSGT